MRVQITYSKDKWDVGKVRELPSDEARLLIREGRAKAYDGPIDEDGYANPTPLVTTVVSAKQSTPARQAEALETPAPADSPAKTSTRRTTPPAPTV